MTKLLAAVLICSVAALALGACASADGSRPRLSADAPATAPLFVSAANCTLKAGRKPPSAIFITRASASVVEARSSRAEASGVPSAGGGSLAHAWPGSTSADSPPASGDRDVVGEDADLAVVDFAR